MRTICKACGAPLQNEKCDCFGTTYRENQTPQQPTNTLNYILQCIMPNIDESQTSSQNELSINIAAGVFTVFNFIVLTIYNSHLFISMEITDSHVSAEADGFLTILLLMIAALVLHIIGLVRSRKHSIPIAGHILGIVGAVITIFTITLLSFISIILFFLAAIIILRKKN